jgi:hypothetical protein
VYSDITTNNEQLLELSRFMSDVAYKNGMMIYSCAEQIDVASAGIEHGKCIDERLIYDVFNLSLDPKKDKGQREECGCIRHMPA